VVFALKAFDEKIKSIAEDNLKKIIKLKIKKVEIIEFNL